MKRIIIFIAIIGALISALPATSIAQNVKFLDPNFKKAVILAGFDLNEDGEIQTAEALKVTRLYVDKRSIESLNGIKSFSNLEEFGFYYNDIRQLDLSGMKKLRAIYGFECKMEAINLKGCTNLETIILNFNGLREIDLTGINKLKEIQIIQNDLHSIDLSNLPLLEDIRLNNNRLTSIKTANSPAIREMQLQKNYLLSQDFTQLKNLELLWIYDNPDLNSLKIYGLRKLKTLNCSDCKLFNLNMSGTVNLKEFSW